MVKGTRQTEEERHRSAGPGKAAKEMHAGPGHAGNKPGQDQSSTGRERHGIGKGGTGRNRAPG